MCLTDTRDTRIDSSLGQKPRTKQVYGCCNHLLKAFDLDAQVLNLLMKLEVDGVLGVILLHHLLKLQTGQHPSDNLARPGQGRHMHLQLCCDNHRLPNVFEQ